LKSIWPIIWTIVGLIVVGEAGFLVFHPGALNALFSRASTSIHERSNGNCASDTEVPNPGTFRAHTPERQLVEAIESDDANRTRAIVRTLKKVPRSGPDGTSLLHYAISRRNKSIVDALIDAGADPKYRGCGEIAMNVLAAVPDEFQARPAVPIAEVLLAHGAPLSNEAEAVRPANRNEPLVTAAVFGDLELVRWLHAHGARIDAKDFRGATPLLAVMMEYDGLTPMRKYKVVQLLLALGADPTAYEPKRGSAVHLAVESGDKEIVRLLLEHRADVKVRDSEGRTPLQYAEFLHAHHPDGVQARNELQGIIALLK
jgi:cytohesin